MKQIIQGEKQNWEIVIGMEIHAQVASKSKLFSRSPVEFGSDPNDNVSLVDAAFPGMLPVINEYCVKQAIKTGLGLNAKINLKSTFDRKNYFYPDLPQGYQISQYKHPIVGEGVVKVQVSNDEEIEVGIERLHLEQDAGKSIHDQHPTQSFVDLNRSGVALMEIVSRPDLRSAEDAKAYVSKLRTILRYLGTCDGDMEKGNLRADVNVSVRPEGSDKLGTRCEIKNVNSLRFIGQAIDYEAQRQVDILESGGTIDQETRLFDTEKGVTRSMRSKEEAHDYRYFPDPDLLPLEFTQTYVDEIKDTLPELPDVKRERLINQMGLTPYDASVITSEKEIADYFEAAAHGHDPKLAVTWVTNELFAALNKHNLSIEESPITAAQISDLLSLIEDGLISGKIAKEVFEILWVEGGSPRRIVEERDLAQVSDTGAIEKIAEDIIRNNPQQVAAYREKPKLFGWFVGQVMKETGGKANPQAVNDILKKLLG